MLVTLLPSSDGIPCGNTHPKNLWIKLKPWFSDLNPKSLGPIQKNLVWYMIFKWSLKYLLNFYVGSMPNLKTADGLFWDSMANSNPNLTQILLPLLGLTFHCLLPYSLSLFHYSKFQCSLSLSSINPSPFSWLTLLLLSPILFILHPSTLKKCLLLIKSPQTHKITIITIHKFSNPQTHKITIIKNNHWL